MIGILRPESCRPLLLCFCPYYFAQVAVVQLEEGNAFTAAEPDGRGHWAPPSFPLQYRFVLMDFYFLISSVQ